MDTIEVLARFDDHGQVHPQRFTWRGHTYPVHAVGRQWRDAAGQHVLVMAGGEKVYELIFVAAELRWYLQARGAQAA